MKVASAVLVAALAGVHQAAASSVALAELSAIVHERRDLALTVTMGLACAGAEPCGTNGCMSLASLAMSDTCGPILTNFSDVLGPDSSDGDSVGIAALLADVDLPEGMDAAVCSSFKNSTLANSCVLPAPLEAIVATMNANKGSSCKDFNTEILALINKVTETPAWEPSVAATLAQKGVMERAMAGYITAAGAGNGTAVAAAMSALGASWEWFLSPGVGLVPDESDVEGALSGAAGACLSSHIEGLDDIPAVILLSDMFVNPDSYTDEVVEAKIMEMYNATIVQLIEDSLPEHFNTTDGFSMTRETVVDVLVGSFVNSSAAIDDLPESIAFDCMMANSNSSGEIINFANALMGGLNTSNDGDVMFFVGDSCEGASNETECGMAVLADMAEFETCAEFAETKATEMLLSLETRVAAALGTIPGFVKIMTLESAMETCFFAPLAVVKGYFDMFANAANGTASATEMAFVSGAVANAGCQLALEHATENANPARAHKSMCYIMHLSKAEPDLTNAFIASPRAVTDEILFGLEDSTGNLETRCETAGVSIGAFPVYTPVDPNEPVETNAPTPGSTVVLNGASVLGPQLMAVTALAYTAFANF